MCATTRCQYMPPLGLRVSLPCFIASASGCHYNVLSGRIKIYVLLPPASRVLDSTGLESVSTTVHTPAPPLKPPEAPETSGDCPSGTKGHIYHGPQYQKYYWCARSPCYQLCSPLQVLGTHPHFPFPWCHCCVHHTNQGH
jgi:hypothetical protein